MNPKQRREIKDWYTDLALGRTIKAEDIERPAAELARLRSLLAKLVDKVICLDLSDEDAAYVEAELAAAIDAAKEAV